MKKPKEWRVSCKKRQIRERITMAPKSVGEIKRIMKKSQPLPPVTLYRVNNKYYVMDGHHRVSAAKLLCHNEIVANVISIEMKR